MTAARGAIGSHRLLRRAVHIGPLLRAHKHTLVTSHWGAGCGVWGAGRDTQH